MKFVSAALPALLLATAAVAQEVPAQSKMDLWCGLAFGLVSADAPTDVTPEQQAIIDQYATGGESLVARASVAHLEAGYTEQSFAAYKTVLTADITRQINATDGPVAYTFEDCSALIGL